MNPYYLENIYRQIPKSSCPSNCGACCGILYPSLTEIRNIEQWCKTHGKEYEDFNMKVGLDCLYLGEQKDCMIYSVRPFLCRILGVSTDLPCPIGKCKSSKLLNHPQSSALYKAIYLHGKEKHRTEKHRRLVRELLFNGIAR